MTPDDLAALHPYLFHVTSPASWPQIQRHGLLSAQAAVDLFDPPSEIRAAVLTAQRPHAIPLKAPSLGAMEVNDQLPLSEKALERCLDDGLTATDWLTILNARVFFWPSEAALDRLLSAKINRTRPRDILVFDTLSVATEHLAQIELSPINSGATIRKPARRGHSSFTPLAKLSYRDWRRQRGGLEKIAEVSIRGSMPGPQAHLIRIDHHTPDAQS